MTASAPAAQMLDAALSYADHLVPTFPVWGVNAGRCLCGKFPCGDHNRNAGKHPLGALVSRGVLDATTDHEIIRAWWSRYPQANIATPTSWATVLDVDPRHGGDDALAALEREHGPLPDTAEVLTGGGGRHIYFRPVTGLAPSAGKVGSGLDVKAGPGAYVLLPPSSHVSGTYLDEIMRPLFDTPLAEMPAWLVGRAKSTTTSESTNGHRSPDDWAQKLIGAPEGQRRAITLEIGGHYLGLRIAPAEVEAILLGFAARCTPPFSEREVREIVRDLARRDRARAKAKAVSPPGAEDGHTWSPWDAAQPVRDFLAGADDGDVQYLDRLCTLVAGALTEWFSPRGLGKTHLLHALLVALALAGLRVLLLDRDNPSREIKRRLRAWGAGKLDAEHFRIMTRDDTPPLTDRAAWEQFPFADYDVVALDSLDASTEGVGEQDSAKPARAIAALLDLAHRASGPAVIVLGNTTKSGQAGRGSGVIEDRADIVYEIRDATDFQPTGKLPWWEELPAAGRVDWASRATRRKRRDTYRLAIIATKHRVGPEPDPRVVEISLSEQPWTWRDVTDELVASGEQAKEEAERGRLGRITAASKALVDELEMRRASGQEMPGKREAEALLQACGLTRKAARDLLTEGTGVTWRLTPRDGKTVLVTPVSDWKTAVSSDSVDPHKQRGFFTPNAADRINTGRPHSSTKNAREMDTADVAAPSAIPPARAREEEIRL